MKTVLMIAFHFPPHGESTGRLRTLSFTRHLRDRGWRPIVLTARPDAYPPGKPSSTSEIPEGVQVVRAAGFDVARTLSIRGIYPKLLALPDRWTSWALGALRSGLKTVRTGERPAVIWATFPIPSALLAGLFLSRLTKIPLVIDLRDPIVYESWPIHRLQRRIYQWIERRAVRQASAVVSTTPGSRALYVNRYPDLPPERFRVIPNGVDEATVQNFARSARPPADLANAPLTLLHSGLMEFPDRDPTAFFQALAAMSNANELPARGLKVLLRATGQDETIRDLAGRHGLSAIVEVAPPLPREDALAELLSASALLLFQGKACNRQIPAKAYEYLASRRPIIGLMDPDGDTHALVVREWNVPYHADMADAARIRDMLKQVFAATSAGPLYVAPEALLERHSRREQANALATLLDGIAPGHGVPA